MELIKKENGIVGNNSACCSVTEYSFNEKDMDFCISTITGRYPEEGYAQNTICKELVYVLEGNGKIVLEDKVVEFKQGDTFIIQPQEKYYWNTKFCKVTLTCNPAWSKEQYKIVK